MTVRFCSLRSDGLSISKGSGLLFTVKKIRLGISSDEAGWWALRGPGAGDAIIGRDVRRKKGCRRGA